MRGRLLALGLLLVRCAPASAPAGPDHTRVFEVKTHARTYRDLPFDAEVVTQLRTPEVLDDLDVRALAVSGDTVWAGTASGLLSMPAAGERFERFADARTATTVVDLVAIEGGVLVGLRGAVARIEGGAVTAALAVTPAGPDHHGVVAVERAGDGAFVATARALLRVDATGTTTAAALIGIRDLALAPNGLLWIAAADGVHTYDPARGTVTRGSGDPDARAVAIAGAAVWIAWPEKLARMDLAASFAPAPGGLPTGDVRALAASAEQVLLGHRIGASAIEGAAIEHYHSLRWLPAEEVRAVALGPGRTRWVGTAGGVARIAYAPTTLGAKAAALEPTIERDHLRLGGFVNADVGFASPYDHSAGPMHWDNDNDGLWTEMQLGTWCLAYAATGDERFRLAARRSLAVLFQQIDVPAATYAAMGRSGGYIAKSLVRDDEGALYESKKDDAEWRTQTFGGHDYRWKINSSSDEFAGHYWGLPLYHDLCAADDAERAAVAQRLRQATDHVIANGYQIIDIAGNVHDHWDRLSIAVQGLDRCAAQHDLGLCINNWGGAGWLNGIEILGMLLATWHVTGDQKYLDEYERLYTTEKYGLLIPVTADTLTVSSPGIANHSDHELATLAYFTLLRYEPDPARRAIVVKSMRDFYAYERGEHNPWQVATLGMGIEEDVDLDGAIESLRDMPLDRRNWNIDNAHRRDAFRGPPDRAGNPQFDRAFPYDEINCLLWNGDPYNVADGFRGFDVITPTPYLIGYWMMRYNGLIQP